MICPNCKREITVPGRFCGYCGETLAPDSVDDDDKMKTMMADDDDIVTEELDSDGMDGPEKETYSTEYAGDSDKNITLVRTDDPETPDISTQSSEPVQTRKKKQRQKENAVSMWIRIGSAAAILLVVVCSVLAVRFFWSKRDENLIVQLSDLDYVETEEAGSSKASKTYILDSQFERMSVKATMKQLSAASSSEDKLLQIWIDDSLVYEIEAGQSEKEDWTFAIDLRGVDRMTIFTAKETTLDDVQVIRQSAEKETESTNAKNGSSKK